MLAAGIGRLRLTPAVFWSLSLPEWRALQPPRRAALSRRVFETLMQRYPDERHGQ